MVICPKPPVDGPLSDASYAANSDYYRLLGAKASMKLSEIEVHHSANLREWMEARRQRELLLQNKPR